MLYYLISIDCESTGLSVYNDQIVELGGIISLWESTTNTITTLDGFAEYAKPTIVSMSKKAEEITGIREETFKNSAFISTVFTNFLQYVNTVCKESYPRLLLSYNGFGYDIPLIVNELERIEDAYALKYFRQLCIAYTIDILSFCREEVDTTILKRKADGTCSYKLGDVYSAICKCPLLDAHGALTDSSAVLELLEHDTCLLNKFRLVVEKLESCVDTQQCKNPMAFVRHIVGKKRKCTSSKRPLDMILHFRKKQKIIK
jgi:DNA polymerase III epsilon subunit-like protein